MPILMGVAAAAGRRKAGPPRPAPTPPTAAIVRKSRLLMVVPLLGGRRRSEDRSGRAPSTLTAVPVMSADESEARNTTGSATSSSDRHDAGGEASRPARRRPAPVGPRARRVVRPPRSAPDDDAEHAVLAARLARHGQQQPIPARPQGQLADRALPAPVPVGLAALAEHEPLEVAEAVVDDLDHLARPLDEGTPAAG